jgi:hypothetical protein
MAGVKITAPFGDQGVGLRGSLGTAKVSRARQSVTATLRKENAPVASWGRIGQALRRSVSRFDQSEVYGICSSRVKSIGQRLLERNLSGKVRLFVFGIAVSTGLPQAGKTPQGHLQLRLADARIWNSTILGGEPTEWRLIRFTQGEKRYRPHRLVGTLAELEPQLVEWNRRGYNVYAVINIIDEAWLRHCRDTSEDYTSDRHIVGCRALFVDMDDREAPGSPSNLERLQQAPLRPSVINRSSASWKHQAFWLVRGVPVHEFTPIQKALIERFGSDPKIHNESRVMRVPGFMHHKEGKQVLSHLIEAEGRIYSREEFLEAFRVDPEGFRKARANSREGGGNIQKKAGRPQKGSGEASGGGEVPDVVRQALSRAAEFGLEHYLRIAAQHYPRERSHRNDYVMGISSDLWRFNIRNAMPLERAKAEIERMAIAAGDEEVESRKTLVARTYRRADIGMAVAGFAGSGPPKVNLPAKHWGKDARSCPAGERLKRVRRQANDELDFEEFRPFANREVADCIGISEKTVGQTVEELAALGELEVRVEGKGRSKIRLARKTAKLEQEVKQYPPDPPGSYGPEFLESNAKELARRKQNLERHGRERAAENSSDKRLREAEESFSPAVREMLENRQRQEKDQIHAAEDHVDQSRTIRQF